MIGETAERMGMRQALQAKQWAQALSELHRENNKVTAYWLEVCLQSGKLEMQLSLRRMDFNQHFKDLLDTIAFARCDIA